ncbi:MAG: Flp family type IVb pilin [Pseudolabrys sp.]|nr:Flp family type IVb pilin [Pseudolabrys sp.]
MPCTMMIQLRRFLRDQSGATAIEYAIIAAGIAAAIAGAISILGVSVTAKWEAVSTALR